MAYQNRKQTKPGGLRPLPKPQRPAELGRANRPVQPIDPDDFEFRRPTPPRRRNEPTLGEAFIIFLKRMRKRYVPQSQRKRKPNYAKITRAVGIVSLGVVCVALIVLILWSLTNKNAYAVYLGDAAEPIGYIARAKDIVEADIQAAAVAKLEASLGARVQVSEQTRIELTHAAQSKIIPDSDVIDLISRGFTYKIAATAIFVEGREIVVLKTYEEAQSVAEQLQAPYVTENTKEASFVEDWEYVTQYVDEDELGVAEDALLQLDKKTRAMMDYTIQSGDNLGVIARRNNTTVDKICQDNPGYTTTTILRVGDILQLETTKPYLSVITTEETTRKETTPAPLKNIENPNEYVTYTKVIQEGRDGEQEITVRIVRINGVQTEPEQIVSTVPIIEPIERIVEIGTSQTVPQQR